MASSSRLFAIFLVLSSAVLFSAKSILIKLGYREGVDALTLMTLRMFFALPFFLAMVWFSRQKEQTPLTKRDWFHLSILGFAGYYLASLFDFMGLEYISASLERLILFLYPTITVFISAVFLKKPLSKATWVAVGVSYLGMLVVFAKDAGHEGPHLWLGALLVFASAVSYAGYLVGSGQIVARIGATRLTGIVLSISCIICVLHFGISNSLEQITHLSAYVYALGLAIAFFCTVMPAILLSHGIKHIGASQAALIGAIGPVSTIYLGYVFLGEAISAWQMAGTSLVLLGVLIITMNKE